MMFRLLRSPGITVDNAFHSPREGRVQGIFAALLLRRGQNVSSTNLAAAIWSDPPVSADANVRTYIAKLRRFLADISPELHERLATVHGGYRLDILDGELDLGRSNELWNEGRRAMNRSDFRGAVEALQSASALWVETSGQDVAAQGWLDHRLAMLREQRFALAEDLAAARIASGDGLPAIAGLPEIDDPNLAREKTAALMLVACYRAGNLPAALRVFAAARTTLRREFGVEPGSWLQTLHHAALRRDDALLFSDQLLVSLSRDAEPRPQHSNLTARVA
ncbi:AfsR/SARP family transcriptional regulator [Micromonospora vinacea]|uniref:AfsR/SARP family transcriptional regulator n=1 Tax=Micromonospora TaxID=1873 RepID=UPI0038641920